MYRVKLIRLKNWSKLTVDMNVPPVLCIIMVGDSLLPRLASTLGLSCGGRLEDLPISI